MPVSAISPAIPRVIPGVNLRKPHNVAPISVGPTVKVVHSEQVQLPRTEAIRPEFMPTPRRESVISHAGAAFWAAQAIREDDERHEKKFELRNEEIDIV